MSASARLAARALTFAAWLSLIMLGGGIACGLALAWRLSVGPIDVTEIVRRLEVSRALPVAIGIRHAALSWQGVDEGIAAPLVLTLDGLSISAQGGRALDRLGRTAVALSPRALLSLRLAPLSVDAEDGALVLHRRADGDVELAPGFPLGAPAKAGPGPAPREERQESFWHWIRRIRLSGLDLDVTDDVAGTGWHARDVGAILVRHRSSFTGRLDATLSVAGSDRAETRFAVKAEPIPGGTAVAATMTPIEPAALAPLAAPLAALHARLGLALAARFDRDLTLRDLRADGVLGAGAVGGLAVQGGAVHLRFVPDRAARLRRPSGTLLLDSLDLDLAAGRLSLSGRAEGDPDGALLVRLAATSPRLAFARLAASWPEDLARGARRWITTNMPSGFATDVSVQAGLASARGFEGLGLTTLAGGFSGEALEIHWLRPIPPITDGQAQLRLDGPDRLSIALARGHVGAIDASGTTMRITGITGSTQTGTIEARLHGKLPDLLGLLAEKRLRLLSRRPLGFTDPAGTVVARVAVTLPLEDRVTMEQVTLAAHAELTRVHLGNVALGLPIDDGSLSLDADTDGLSLAGTASFDRVPVDLAAHFDFRAGGPSQVTESADVTAREAASAFAADGLPTAGADAGELGLAAHYRLTRDARARIVVDADLGDAALATPLGWDKKRGEAASVHAEIGLDQGRLVSIERAQAQGPGLDIALRGIVQDGRVTAITVRRAAIGRTSLGGRVDLPDIGGGPYRVTLAGATLDLGGWIAERRLRVAHARTPSHAQGSPEDRALPAGPSWTASLAFGTVLLGHKRSLGEVRADFSGTGTRFLAGRITAAGPAPLAAHIATASGRSSLSVDTDDAGTLLDGLDLTGRVNGGRLALDGSIADDGTVAGTLRMNEFRISQAPVAARVLRDLTVYGLADRAPGREITVNRLVAPFTWSGGILDLDRARAFQSAVGLTAHGRIDTVHDRVALRGTIVPAYALNTLPGRLPLIGKLFSPERGGGVFAATYALSGSLSAPDIKVNPLAALVPGMLRDLLNH